MQSISFAQVPTEPPDSTQEIINEVNEQLLERGTEDLESSQTFDDLEQLKKSPLDLNEATVEELTLIPTIDAPLANAIVDKREHVGRFNSINEIKSISGMDENKFALLSAYTQIKIINPHKGYLQSLSASYRGRVQQDEQASSGFTSGKYLGSRPKIYSRLTVEDNTHLSAGALAEKDAGEQSLTDHVVGFISLNDVGPIKRAVAGDYALKIGQGIMLWTASAFSKGSEVIATPKRSGNFIRPFLSAEENKFYRGAAIQSQFNSFSVIAFYSNHFLDATVDSLGHVISFDGTGLHRTVNEISKSETAKEKMFGGAITSSFEIGKLKSQIGIAGYSSAFDTDVIGSTPTSFNGRSSNMFGLNYEFYYSRYNFFGEWVRSHTSAIGGVTGLTAALTENIHATILYRNFPTNFISIHGFAFGEQSGSTQNEEGIYTGIEFHVLPNLKITTYFDQFRFPGRTFDIPLPSSGNDLLIQSEYKPTSKIILTFRYKREKKDDMITTVNETNQQVKEVALRSQQNVRCELLYRVSTKTHFRLRGEFVDVYYDVNHQYENGYLLFADVQTELFKRLSLSSRIVTYQTAASDSRIYEYETDLQGAFSNISLYGNGVRLYLLLRYELLNQIELTAKYAKTIHDGAKTIGSGNDVIQGDTQGRFSLQIDVGL